MTCIKTVTKKFATVVLSAILLLGTSLLVPNTAQAVTESEVDAALARLDSVKAEASEAAESYYAALDAHDEAVSAMEDAQAKIDETSDLIAANQEKLSDRAVAMYRSGSLTLLDVIFGSTSFTEFATLWNLLVDMNENDAELISQTKELRAEQQAAYDEYAEQEQVAADQLEASEAAWAETQERASAVQAEFDSLSSELQAQVLAQEGIETDSATTGSDSSSTGGATGGSSSSSSSSSSSGGYVSNGSSSGPCCNVSLALSLVGCDYEYGATGPDKFDCSGFVYYCGAPYRSSASLYANAVERLPVSQAQAGDVLWRSGHVGISLGGNDYVHASDYGIGVVVSHNASSAFTYVLRF